MLGFKQQNGLVEERWRIVPFANLRSLKWNPIKRWYVVQPSSANELNGSRNSWSLKTNQKVRFEIAVNHTNQIERPVKAGEKTRSRNQRAKDQTRSLPNGHSISREHLIIAWKQIRKFTR